MMQVAYFKITKRKYGEGHRIFKMTPLHHHFQKEAPEGAKVLIRFPKVPIPESRIVIRFGLWGAAGSAYLCDIKNSIKQLIYNI